MPIAEGGRFSPDQNIVSPGVFTRELDQSGIASGVSNIGGAVVAPFPQGPWFLPMAFTNVQTLQNAFGTPDGVYYGPYTATQYLQQQGIVTVCRVGGLTGYQQNYPFAIWAVKGFYGRGPSAGAFVSASSYVFLSGSLGDLGYPYSTGVTFASPTTSSTVSTMSIANPNLTVTFAPLAADDVLVNPLSQSGSLLYAGQTITLGQASSTPFAYTPLQFIANVTSASFSSSLLSTAGTSSLSASIPNGYPLYFPSGSAPFGPVNGNPNDAADAVYIYSGSISLNLGVCGFPLFLLAGVLSGSFGNYNGVFTSTPPVFNPCAGNSGSWTVPSGSDMKLLAVLADTQAGGIQNLVAPGFYSSSLVSTTPISGTNSITQNFTLNLYNSNNSTSPYGAYQFSLNPDNTSFITNVFGNVATVGNPSTQVPGQKIEASYLYSVYLDSINQISDQSTQWGIFGAALPSGSLSGAPMNFTDQFSFAPSTGDSVFSITNATTPWIVSQQIAPWQSGSAPTRFNLFQVATLSDGTDTNEMFKLEISNVRLAGTVAGTDYGTFSLILRQFSDTDKNPVIVEQYNNLTLDPTDDNYVARIIGDQYSYINNTGKVITFGIFPNNSQNIRIIVNANPIPITAVPAGFNAFTTPTNGVMGYWTPTMKFTKASVYGLQPGRYPSGITFNDAPTGADSQLFSLYPQPITGVGAADDNIQYMAPIPSFNTNGGTYASTGRNIVFGLDVNYNSYNVGTSSFGPLGNSNAIPYIYDPVNESTYVLMRSFVLGFQGGFDGESPAISVNVGDNIIAGNTQGLDCTTVNSAGSIAYNQSIQALGNADQYDINLIVAPGIIYQAHPYVVNQIVDMCTNRGDCFYIMDLYVDEGNPSTSQINQVVSYAAEFDTSYAAAYYPWVTIIDTFNNQYVTVPPSVVLPAVYALNDSVAAEWFAPAGLNRGGIPTAVGVTDRTTHTDRDTLYQGKVNPIASFPGTGVSVWGQKTLQNAASALNRVNVRRLLINLKKFFASTSQYLVFEQNVAATRNKFLSIVNPYMESVQQRSGLYAFYVQMDNNNNTPDIIDQNILYGQIYIQPTKTAEYIVLDFNILPTGASFPNA